MSVISVTYKDDTLGLWNGDGTLFTYQRIIDDATFINLLYNKVLNQVADQEGFDFWAGALNGLYAQNPIVYGALGRGEIALEFLKIAKTTNPNFSINKAILGDNSLVEATHIRGQETDWNSADLGVLLNSRALTAIASVYENILHQEADIDGVMFWYNAAKEAALASSFNGLFFNANTVQNYAIKYIVESIYPNVQVDVNTLNLTGTPVPDVIKGLNYVKIDIEHDLAYQNPFDPGNKSNVAESVLYAAIAKMNQAQFDATFNYPAGSIKDIPVINTYDDLIKENAGLIGIVTPEFSANHLTQALI